MFKGCQLFKPGKCPVSSTKKQNGATRQSAILSSIVRNWSRDSWIVRNS